MNPTQQILLISTIFSLAFIILLTVWVYMQGAELQELNAEQVIQYEKIANLRAELDHLKSLMSDDGR